MRDRIIVLQNLPSTTCLSECISVYHTQSCLVNRIGFRQETSSLVNSAWFRQARRRNCLRPAMFSSTVCLCESCSTNPDFHVWILICLPRRRAGLNPALFTMLLVPVCILFCLPCTQQTLQLGLICLVSAKGPICIQLRWLPHPTAYTEYYWNIYDRDNRDLKCIII